MKIMCVYQGNASINNLCVNNAIKNKDIKRETIEDNCNLYESCTYETFGNRQ